MPYVNGQNLVTPQVQVQVNDSGLLAPNGNQGYGLLLIGSATDGEPQSPLVLTSPQAAAAQLKGGDLLQAALLAFQPGPSVKGPSAITAIRVDEATRGTATLDSTAPAAAVALTTTSYGTVANLSKVLVANGSNVGYAVTLATDATGPAGSTFQPVSQDNISLPVIQLSYSGTGTSPTATASDTELTVTAVTSDTGGTVTITSGMTVQQLVNAVNAFPGWSALAVDPNPQDVVYGLLDSVTSVAVGTSSSPTTLYGNVAAVVRWINATGAYFTAVRDANPTNLAPTVGYVYASGGALTSPTNTDWQNAYTVAETVPGIDIVVPVIGSPSIWTMNDQHCQYMASIGQPRRGYVGDVLGQSIATESSEAAAVNSPRTSLVWPGLKGTSMNGVATTFAPYLAAAQVAGARAGSLVPAAITRAELNASGLETPLTNAQVAQANAAGIACLRYDAQGNVRLSWDRTTWTGSSATDKIENLTGLIIDTVTEGLSGVLASFVGEAVTPSLVGHIAQAMLSTLNNFYQGGLLAVKPQASDVSLSASGEVVSGTVNVYADEPGNYITITLNALAAPAVTAAS